MTLPWEYIYSREGLLKPALAGSLSISLITWPSGPGTNSIKSFGGDTASAASRGSDGTAGTSRCPGAEGAVPAETAGDCPIAAGRSPLVCCAVDAVAGGAGE